MSKVAMNIATWPSFSGPTPETFALPETKLHWENSSISVPLVKEAQALARAKGLELTPAMVEGYAADLKLPISTDELRAAAVEWTMTRGSRSGRVAWQCIQDVAGRLGVKAAA